MGTTGLKRWQYFGRMRTGAPTMGLIIRKTVSLEAEDLAGEHSLEHQPRIRKITEVVSRLLPPRKANLTRGDVLALVAQIEKECGEKLSDNSRSKIIVDLCKRNVRRMDRLPRS